MAEEDLFVRIRGRVQGPYAADKLRALVRRGQLSRMHEVSCDGNIWKPASEFPDLFASASVEAVRAHGETQRANSSSMSDIPGIEPPSMSLAASWYYSCDGSQKGPTSFEQLKALAATGSIGPDDLVWSDGMSEWVAARSVRGLSSSSAMDATGGNGMANSDRVGGELIRTLTESRPWTSFIAMFALTVGVILLVSGALGVVIGARRSEVKAVAGGGFLILYAVVCLWGGQLLSSYNRCVNSFLRDTSARNLDLSCRSLRRCWIFTSIILIVVLVNLIAALIWAFSVGLVLFG